jgi:hypothetical protein
MLLLLTLSTLIRYHWSPNTRAPLEGAGKDKAGYKKIIFCTEQAAPDGLQYFWVDTCCTDKSSSTARSNTLN